MINTVFGRLGTHKTMYSVMAAYAIQAYMPYKTLHANFTLEDGTVIQTFDDIMELHDAIVILDEAHLFMNSRNYQSKENKALSQFGLISRKHGLEIFIISPRLNSIDINIRDITDFFHYMKLEGEYVIQEVYENDMISDEIVQYGSNRYHKSLFRPLYGTFDTREKPSNFMKNASLA